MDHSQYKMVFEMVTSALKNVEDDGMGGSVRIEDLMLLTPDDMSRETVSI